MLNSLPTPALVQIDSRVDLRCMLHLAWLRLLGLILLSWAACPPLSAGQALDTGALKRLSLEELGSIEVTSVSKVPETLWNTPAAVYVLTQTDIARSGATSIPDALRLVPGVEVARVDTSRNWVVGIRGFGDQYSKSVLVMVDGRHLYTPLWAGVHWPLVDLVLEDIDRIEVIRGPGGTVWGTNAQNGVINIVTKSAADTQGTLVSAVSGNVDRGIVSARYGGRRGALAYRFYGKGSSRAPQAHIDNREFDTWAMGQAGGRLDWASGRDQLTVQGDGYGARLGESVQVHTFDEPRSFLVDDPVDLHGVNVLGRWQRQLASRGQFSLLAYVDHTYRLGTDFGERRTTIDVDMVHRWRAADRHELVWGAGARSSPSEVTQTYAFSSFTPLEHTYNVFSAYMQDTFALIPRRVALTGGAKLEHNTYTGWQLQPSVRVLWTPSEHQSAWAAASRAVRTPSRVDEDISVALLAIRDPLTYVVLQGNRDLEPETVWGFEGGYRSLVIPSVFVDVAAFNNRYGNLVDVGQGFVESRVSDGVPYRALVVPWINGNTGRTRGVEISPDWQPSSKVRLRGSYSYAHLRVDPEPFNTRQVTRPQLEGSTPRHQLSLQALLTFGGVQIDPVYRYVDARAALSVPAYHTADLHVRVPLRRGMEVAFLGHNLLQPQHVEWARDPGPPVAIRRSLSAALVIRR